ncbi:fascin-3-like [Mustelus asterias]
MNFPVSPLEGEGIPQYEKNAKIVTAAVVMTIEKLKAYDTSGEDWAQYTERMYYSFPANNIEGDKNQKRFGKGVQLVIVMSNSEAVKIGLITSCGKYLTAEQFGNMVSLITTALGPKQIWEVKFKSSKGFQVQVELIAFNGLALQTNKAGLVKCAPPNEFSLFLLEYQSNGSWVFKSIVFGTYLEKNIDGVRCIQKEENGLQQWIPHLAIHPQIVLYHPQSKSYVRMHCSEGNGFAEAPAPFSEECIFLIHFDNGKYHLQTSDCRYLSVKDQLLSKRSKQTAFTMHLKAGYMATFSAGKRGVLYPHSRTGLLSIGMHPSDMQDIFIIKRSKPWITLKTKSQKYVTINYGVEVYARFENFTQLSLFQFEVNLNSDRVRLRTIEGLLLAQRRQAAILADGKDTEETTNFTVRWCGGNITLQAANKQYLTMKPIGQIVASAQQAGPNEEFTIRLANRPFLILRGEHGYIATDCHSDQLQCSRRSYEIIRLTQCKGGFYHFQGSKGKLLGGVVHVFPVLAALNLHNLEYGVNGRSVYFRSGTRDEYVAQISHYIGDTLQKALHRTLGRNNGKFWTMKPNGIFSISGETPLDFSIEIHANNLLTIKAPNGCYLCSDHNGVLSALSTVINSDSLWEF